MYLVKGRKFLIPSSRYAYDYKTKTLINQVLYCDLREIINPLFAIHNINLI